MTLLMLVGAIGFCIFLVLAISNMLAFKLSKKREWLFEGLILVVIALILIIRNSFQLSVPTTFLVFGFLMMVWSIFKYRSFAKGMAFTVYMLALVVGLNSILLLVSRLLGLGNDIVLSLIPLAIIIALTGIVFFLLTEFSPKLLSKYIDVNIFNNQIMRLLAISAGIALVFIYINFAIEDAVITLGQWTVDFGDIAYMLFFISSVVMFIMVLRYISKETAIQTEMLLTEASKQYIHDLEESYNALRTLKHDYKNILISLKLHIDNDDMAGLSKYYYDDLAEINKDWLYQDKLVGNLQNLQLNELKSILLYKSSVAIQQGIDTNIEVSEPIESLGVSTAIVCQMLGIFLDNAMEAAIKTAHKKIEIAIIKNPTSKVFIVKNSWNEQNVPIDKFFELGFSTNADGRGVGLYTVQSYVKKINGLNLETEISDEYFTQILTV